jgi:hypothetical protein
MKKSFLAVALAAAFTTMTFAQTTPPSSPQNPPSQDSGTKKTHKTKKNKKAKKAGNTTPSK